MLQKRPPIVTVLGHVDHGKTTLLDAIRKTDVAVHEAGGITQGIGASQLNTSEGAITFLDTPGHEAFSGMRKRGAKLADIAILVVASDDGIMPQTREAIGYLRESNTPFLVAFTKTDLPSARVESVIGELEKDGIFFEGRGGQTPSVLVSAKKGEGIKDVIELINLMAEINEISADREGDFDGVIVESNKDQRGVSVSAVIRNGTLKVGMKIYGDGQEVKVRGLFDQNNKPVREVFPGDPVVILGFSTLPEVGSVISSRVNLNLKTPALSSQTTLEVSENKLPVLIKVANQGSIDAVKHILPKGVVVLRADVGEVIENDVFFAKTSGAIILAFEAKISNSVKKLAENEGVEFESFKIIYKISDYLNERLGKENLAINGKADILATFPYNKQIVAGCKVTEGKITKGDDIEILRGDKVLGSSKVVSMRREKNTITEAKQGEECGIVTAPQIAFDIGDIIVSVKK